MQYVYILRCGVDHYKVGVAKSVAKRIKALQTSNPSLISIVSTRLVVDAYAVEQQLHGLLREFHTDGGKEWFSLTPEQAIDLAMTLGRTPEVDVMDKMRLLGIIGETRAGYRALQRMLATIIDNQHHSKQETPKPRLAPAPQKSDELREIKPDDDDIATLALDIFATEGKVSTSLLQRRMSIGYGRASRIMDKLERDGLITPLDGAHARELRT